MLVKCIQFNLLQQETTGVPNSFRQAENRTSEHRKQFISQFRPLVSRWELRSQLFESKTAQLNIKGPKKELIKKYGSKFVG